MNTGYRYELWNGKEVVGYYHSPSRLFGKKLIIAAVSELKAVYGKTYEQITVPIVHRTITSSHSDITIRQVLDVRKKSPRQLDLIMAASL